VDFSNLTLLIDPVPQSRQSNKMLLEFMGESVVPCDSNCWAVQLTEQDQDSRDFCMAVINHPDTEELSALLQDLRQWDENLPVILLAEPDSLTSLISDQPNIAAIVDTPLTYQPLLDAVHRAKLIRDNATKNVAGSLESSVAISGLVGSSTAIQQVKRLIEQVAGKEVTILVTGESGTGKEVVARNLHLNSVRSAKPFVAINCGAIPGELLESELFGHERGAFTGAVAAREGRFELAEGGTLFLDEIGDMPLSMQVKLLRVLQERKFERVGGVKTITADVRIIAATHKNLESMIADGEFREDLYYRINVFPIEMPPLRDRAEDVPSLLHEMISNLEAEKRGSVRFNSSALESLKCYGWPGNVRELANLVERMSIIFPHGIVGVNDLPEKILSEPVAEVYPVEKTTPPLQPAGRGLLAPQGASELLSLDGIDIREYLANMEKGLIEQALQDSGGVVAHAADRLQLRRTTLVEKIRKYNLHKSDIEQTSDSSATQTSKQLASG